MRRLYTLLLVLLGPFWWLLVMTRDPAYRQGLVQRLGWIPRQRRDVIWLHAASVGEVAAAQPLIEGLLRQYPGEILVVSTYTPGGRDMLKRRFGTRVQHVYLAHDLPGMVKRFLERLRPRLGIMLETELWPNLYHQAIQCGTPLLLVNARLSPRSARRYASAPGRALFGPLLRELSWVGAQTQADAGRLLAAGVRPERLEVIGNLKFDLVLPADTALRAGQLRRLWGERPVCLAASTHDDEETRLLRVFRQLREAFPELLLVLVPRHAPRFDTVADLVRRQGWALVRRSEQRPCPASCAVFLGDSLGELPAYCQAADVIFMGGSLVPVGGHNPLEPAALGKAVITGPRVTNFQAIYQALAERDAVSLVADEAALADELRHALEDPQWLAGRGERARALVEEHRGASAKTLAAIGRYLQ